MRRSFDIEGMHVFNWARGYGGTEASAARGLVMHTCLRRLVVQQDATFRPRGAEHYRGEQAYRYLLEVTTGLRSKVPGETNVFGQFRTAVASFRRDGDRKEVARLVPILDQVEQDTRNIRRRNLTDVGGASYGRLVRRLIGPSPSDRILIVGAGNLAQSLLPFFSRYPIGLWNRSWPRVRHAGLRVFAAHERQVAARWAKHIILTTPPVNTNDGAWRDVLGEGQTQTTVHLGHRREQHTAWTGGGRYYNLDDVFELRAALEVSTSLQLARAREACRTAAAVLCAAAPEQLVTRALPA